VNLVEYLARATEYLDRHQVTSPRLNAEVMLANMLGISRVQVYTSFERVLTPGEAGAYRDFVMRRAGGVPLQYITGETGFRGLVLETREGVFIPRPETEILVEKALEKSAGVPGGRTVRVLDVGTGCGNVALAIASELEEARVLAVDCSREAVELCARNAGRLGLEGRVRVALSDFYDCLGEGDRFDLVVSNPPYIPEGMRGRLPREVEEHEPERALFAGPEGMDAIRRITAGAPGHLVPGGWLVLEVDESHAGRVGEELTESGWTGVEVFEDLCGRPRVVCAKRGVDVAED